MLENNSLAVQFEAQRSQLRAVAYRMLGSLSEAEDAVQEVWLRVSRSDTSEVENFGGWLTTVMARLCLDLLRSRKAQHKAWQPESRAEQSVAPESNAEEERLLVDSVGHALLVVLETLTPPERLAFVLHDTFELPFDEIADIVGCTPSAARKLASRARHRVRGAPAELEPSIDLEQQRAVVSAFLSASRSGDLAGLLAILDPNVVLRADAKAVAGARASADPGTPQLASELRGSSEVANAFLGRARAAQPALINGAVGAVWAPGGQTRVAFELHVEAGKVVRIDVIADPLRLLRCEVSLVG